MGLCPPAEQCPVLFVYLADGFFVAGLNLTENAKYIVTHPCQSMNSLTMRNYSAFLEWVSTQSPGPGSACLNIICGDFVVGIRHFASTVIDLNKKLSQSPL